MAVHQTKEFNDKVQNEGTGGGDSGYRLSLALVASGLARTYDIYSTYEDSEDH